LGVPEIRAFHPAKGRASIVSEIQNQSAVLTFFLRRKTDAAHGSIIVFADCLNKKETIASRAFLPVQSVLNKHSEKKQKRRKKDGQPVVRLLYVCHCQYQNRKKGKENRQKYPSQPSDMRQSCVYFMYGFFCFHSKSLF